MKDLNTLEQAVLDYLLAGDHPALAKLRVQAEMGHLAGRELTGVGFFCLFEIPPEAPRLDGFGDFQIDDVNATVQGLRHGAGFVLFISEGYLDMLEGFSYDELWPQEIRHFKLTYQNRPRKLSITNVSSLV